MNKADKSWRVLYTTPDSPQPRWADLAASDADAALLSFGRAMGKKPFRVLRVRAARPGEGSPPPLKARRREPRKPPPPPVADSDLERGEWWKSGGTPPADLPA